MKLKKKVYIYKNGEDIAITKAFSKEEAMYKFEQHYPRVLGEMIKEAEYNHLDIAVISRIK